MTKTPGTSVVKPGTSVAKHGTSVAKPGTSVAISHNSTIVKRKPNIDVFAEPIDNDIAQLKYKIEMATTQEEKKKLENQLNDLELEKMTRTWGRRMRIIGENNGGSRKRKTGTKKRAARKGKRKSNRNKK